MRRYILTDSATNLCDSCNVNKHRVFDTRVESTFRDKSTILMLSDFCMEEDLKFGKVLSGLHSRTKYIHRIMKETNMNQDNVSHSTIMRCVTKSKSIIKREDYIHCSKHTIDEIKNNDTIQGIFCFGSIAGTIVSGKTENNIEKLRGKVLDTIFPGVFCVITYSLGLLANGSSCGGCGTNTHHFLTRKDIALFNKEIKQRNK